MISREARLWCGSVGLFSRSFSRSWAFFMLKEWGRGANWFTFLVNSFDSLYAGAFRQFTTWRMGWSGLCIFIRPLMEGADGFMLMYFHLWSLSMRVGLCWIVDLICVWNVLVGSVAFVWKSLFFMKSCSFVSYWCVGSSSDQSPHRSVEVKNDLTSPRAGEPTAGNFLGTRHSASVLFFF